jgi:phage shock protein A
MGLWSRFKALFGAKVNAALDRMEDPGETLDYSYEKQLNLLKEVKRGLADVATSKQRLKLQAAKLEQEDQKLQSQAQQAVMLGRDDLARVAIQRKQAIAPTMQTLQIQVQQLDDQQAKLSDASQKLQTKIDMFRTQKEVTKASYKAAAAQVKISESFTGVSKEMGDIGLTVQRANDRIEQMQARAGALDELIDSGALQDVTALPGDNDIDRQLRLAGGTSDVDAELAALKAQLSAGEDRKFLDS